MEAGTAPQLLWVTPHPHKNRFRPAEETCLLCAIGLDEKP
jgi:hypothetical protein